MEWKTNCGAISRVTDLNSRQSAKKSGGTGSHQNAYPPFPNAVNHHINTHGVAITTNSGLTNLQIQFSGSSKSSKNETRQLDKTNIPAFVRGVNEYSSLQKESQEKPATVPNKVAQMTKQTKVKKRATGELVLNKSNSSIVPSNTNTQRNNSMTNRDRILQNKQQDTN